MRSGGPSGTSSSEESSAGIQYWRMSWPIGVPGLDAAHDLVVDIAKHLSILLSEAMVARKAVVCQPVGSRCRQSAFSVSDQMYQSLESRA